MRSQLLAQWWSIYFGLRVHSPRRAQSWHLEWLSSREHDVWHCGCGNEKTKCQIFVFQAVPYNAIVLERAQLLHSRDDSCTWDSFHLKKKKRNLKWDRKRSTKKYRSDVNDWKEAHAPRADRSHFQHSKTGTVHSPASAHAMHLECASWRGSFRFPMADTANTAKINNFKKDFIGENITVVETRVLSSMRRSAQKSFIDAVELGWVKVMKARNSMKDAC